METIQITNKQAIRIALAQYIGEKCSVCEHKFESVEDIEKKKPICSGKNPLRFACKGCYKLEK